MSRANGASGPVGPQTARNMLFTAVASISPLSSPCSASTASTKASPTFRPALTPASSSHEVMSESVSLSAPSSISSPPPASPTSLQLLTAAAPSCTACPAVSALLSGFVAPELLSWPDGSTSIAELDDTAPAAVSAPSMGGTASLAAAAVVAVAAGAQAGTGAASTRPVSVSIGSGLIATAEAPRPPPPTPLLVVLLAAVAAVVVGSAGWDPTTAPLALGTAEATPGGPASAGLGAAVATPFIAVGAVEAMSAAWVEVGAGLGAGAVEGVTPTSGFAAASLLLLSSATVGTAPGVLR